MEREYFVVCNPKSDRDSESVYGSESITFVHDDSFGDVMVMGLDCITSIGPSGRGIEVTCRHWGDKFRFYCDRLIRADFLLVDAVNTFSVNENKYCNIRDGFGVYGYYDRSSDFQKWKKDLRSARDKREASRSTYVHRLHKFLCSNN